MKIKKSKNLTRVKPKVVCKDYLPMVEGSVTMLFSGGGVGKSFASIRQAMHYVKDTGRKALLWLTEDPEGENRDRYERLLPEFGATPRDYFDDRIDFVTTPPEKLTGFIDGNAVLTEEFYDVRLKAIDYGFVVIDPLLQFNGCDENSNTQAGVFMGAMKTWADEELKCILLLHHANKAEHGGVKHRGASEWQNATRASYLVGFVEDKDYRSFELIKDNGVGYWFKKEGSEEKTQILKVFPPFPEKIEISRNQVRMSFADHKDLKNPKGFEPKTIPFDAIHEYVKSYSYSQFQFQGGHRQSVNNLGYSDVIILDYDEGMTLVKAEKKFANFKALIFTTKSHQKPKGKNPPCDRFRVIIKLKTPLQIDSDTFSDTMQGIMDYFGGEADTSTKDMARVFMPSPEDALHFYTNSERTFDWEDFVLQAKVSKARHELELRHRKMQEKRFGKHRKEGQLLDNELPENHLFRTRNGMESFGTISEGLSVGDKVSVFCNNGHEHSGGQNNLAGFVRKIDYDRVKYQCVGGKCKNDPPLWLQKTS